MITRNHKVSYFSFNFDRKSPYIKHMSICYRKIFAHVNSKSHLFTRSWKYKKKQTTKQTTRKFVCTFHLKYECYHWDFDRETIYEICCFKVYLTRDFCIHLCQLMLLCTMYNRPVPHADLIDFLETWYWVVHRNCYTVCTENVTISVDNPVDFLETYVL